MKKRYLLFLPLFLMFFCINISGVKADNGVACYYKEECKHTVYGQKHTVYEGKGKNKKAKTIQDKTTYVVGLAYGIDYYCNSSRCNAWGRGYVKYWESTEENKRREVGNELNITRYNAFFNQMNFDKRKKEFGVDSNKPTKCPEHLTIYGIGTGMFTSVADDLDTKEENNSSNNGNCSMKLFQSKTYNDGENPQLIENLENVSSTTSGKIDIKIKVPGSNEPITNHSSGNSSGSNKDLIEPVREANKENSYDTNSNLSSSDKLYCSEVLGHGVSEILRTIFLVIMIIGVLVLIFTMSGDFVKAITSADADAMSQAFNKSKTRIIAVIILLLLPTIINFMIDFINNNARIEDGHFEIGNVSECKITN